MARVPTNAIEELLGLLVADKGTFDLLESNGSTRQEIYATFRDRVPCLRDCNAYDLVRNLGREFRRVNKKVVTAGMCTEEPELRGSRRLYQAYDAFRKVYFAHEQGHFDCLQLPQKKQHFEQDGIIHVAPSPSTPPEYQTVFTVGDQDTQQSSREPIAFRASPSTFRATHNTFRATPVSPPKPNTQHAPTPTPASIRNGRKRKYVTDEEEKMSKEELERVLLLEQINESRYRQKLYKGRLDGITATSLGLISKIFPGSLSQSSEDIAESLEEEEFFE